MLVKTAALLAGEKIRPYEIESSICALVPFTIVLFLKKIIYLLFLERGEGREKERERNLIMWLPVM